MRLIYHPGTGTYIDFDECVIIDTAPLTDDQVDALPESGHPLDWDLGFPVLWDSPEDSGFTYHLAELLADIEAKVGLTPENAEWLVKQPAYRQALLVGHAHRLLKEDDNFWSVWWDALNWAVGQYRTVDQKHSPF